MNKEEKIKRLLLFTGIFFIAAYCCAPFLWMLAVSLSLSPDFLSNGHFIPTLKNYSDILSIPSLYFLDYLRNSIFVSLLTAFLCSVVAGMSAYAFSRIRFPGRIFIILSILALSMFPQISMVGYLFKIMTFLGWINTYQGLVLPYAAWSLPLGLWIMLSYFTQIPADIDRAGLVDGANRLQIFFKLILPVTLPGFLSAFLLLFVFAFNEFLFALMLTTDYRARTVPVGLAFFGGLHGEIPWGHIMASSVISSIPVIIIALVFQRYIIQGMTRGAVKQ